MRQVCFCCPCCTRHAFGPWHFCRWSWFSPVRDRVTWETCNWQPASQHPTYDISMSRQTRAGFGSPFQVLCVPITASPIPCVVLPTQSKLAYLAIKAAVASVFFCFPVLIGPVWGSSLTHVHQSAVLTLNGRFTSPGKTQASTSFPLIGGLVVEAQAITSIRAAPACKSQA